MKFTYNPNLVNDGGLNQMRFELGDCLVEPEPIKTAYLCDEEYLAVLEGSQSFKHAKFRCVETLLHRFAFEVTTEIKEAKWQLSDRVDFWKDLYKRLKGELEAEEISSSLFGFGGRKMRSPIFQIGMNDWRN
ncbi:MAG: hypothetical protein IKJ07_05870 [Clostridia bacterium]|nr:hypothetical protein [Clostridia bacterium]